MKRPFKALIDYENWTLEQFEEELRTDPRYKPHLDKYTDEAAEKFVIDYAKDKFKLFSKLDKTREEYTDHQTQFFTLTEEFFEMILNKKLLNLQCLWRAGQIDLPFITVTTDFEYFSKNIHDCPFIEPVTEHEIELGIQYLKDRNWFEPYEYHSLQYYSDFKSYVISEENDTEYRGHGYPELYAYFDTYQNTGSLLKLPDIRGEKERDYWLISREAYGEELKRARIEKGEPEPGTVPYKRDNVYLSTYDRKKFVELYEDEQVKEAYRMYDTVTTWTYDKEEVQDAFDFLLQVPEQVPLLAHEDWKMGLLRSVRYFKYDKIIEHLPYIYETYMMEFEDDDPQITVAKRIAQYDPTDLKNDPEHKYQIEDVMKGRRLSGEPENFDYLDMD